MKPQTAGQGLSDHTGPTGGEAGAGLAQLCTGEGSSLRSGEFP